MTQAKEGMGKYTLPVQFVDYGDPIYDRITFQALKNLTPENQAEEVFKLFDTNDKAGLQKWEFQLYY
jgi:hypothetical protein